jgi:hypothetical protein
LFWSCRENEAPRSVEVKKPARLSALLLTKTNPLHLPHSEASPGSFFVPSLTPSWRQATPRALRKAPTLAGPDVDPAREITPTVSPGDESAPTK